MSYIVRYNDAPIKRFNTQLLDDYFDKAPLIEEEFVSYASEVHTYIINLSLKTQVMKIKF